MKIPRAHSDSGQKRGARNLSASAAMTQFKRTDNFLDFEAHAAA